LINGEDQWAEDFLRKNKLERRKRLALHVGSGKTKNLILKRWPVDHYVQLIRKLLASDPALVVLLFGGPEEQEDNEEIFQTLQAPQVLKVPSRTMKEAAALLKRCDVFVSVDNAFMHLAAAMKVSRQVVIESPTFNKTIEPYHRPFRLVKNPMVAGKNLDYYRYDGRDIQGSTEHLLACMRSISPEAVFDEVTAVLKAE
jgi:heptosyltransferase-2